MAQRSDPTISRRMESTHIVVQCGDTPHRILVRRTARAKRMTLRVRAATRDVVLTLPPTAPLAKARLFAERHGAWISDRLNRLPAPTGFDPGASMPFRGRTHLIVHRPDGSGPVWIEDGERAGGPPLLCVSGQRPFIARRIKDFLVRQARSDLLDAVGRHSAVLNVRAKRITLRDTSSRWGSCSSSGALNFSWRLIMAPPHVLDYLAAHEVAHLVEMNHSAAFWAVTERLVPGYRSAEVWLKEHGAALMRLGLTGGQP